MTIVFAVFVFAASFAQNLPKTGTLSYNGVTYASTDYEYASTPDVVESAITEAMAMKGFKPSSSRRGTLVFRNVVMPYTTGDRIVDAIFSISEKSRSEKDKSVVKVITAVPNAIPDSRPKKGTIRPESVVIEGGAVYFYEGVLPTVANREHSRQVGIQQDALKAAEKKYQDLQSEQKKLEDRLSRLQKEIEDNKKAQEDQARTIEAERQKLQILETQKN